MERNNNNSIIKHTDIFTWALFKDQAKREILVDYNQNNIVDQKKSNFPLDNTINPNTYTVGPGDQFYINMLSNNLKSASNLLIS